MHFTCKVLFSLYLQDEKGNEKGNVVDWDAEIPDCYRTALFDAIHELLLASELKFNRYLFPGLQEGGQIDTGLQNLPILVAALPKCTFWSEDISNALLEVIIFFSVGN